ncbi:ABC transporter ATP-binding protein [Candidatus Saccharibacteria bacterium]|nr:ABC transporter ATP-binding protein [Candidatus Saccharibacteria bacterium]
MKKERIVPKVKNSQSGNAKYLIVLKTYWKYAAPHWRSGVLVILMVVSATLLSNTLNPYLIAKVLDNLVLLEGQGASTIYYQSIKMVILILVIQMSLNFLWRIAEFVSDRLVVRVSKSLSQDSFDKLIAQSYQFFTDQFAGSLVNRYKRFFKNYRVIYKEFVFNILSMMTRIVSAAVVVAFASLTIGVVFAIWVMVFSVIMVYLYRSSSGYADKVIEEDTITTGILSDNLTNALTIKAFGSSEYEERRFARVVDRQLTAYLGYWKRSNILRFIQVIGLSLFETLVLYLTVVAVSRGSLSLAMAILMQFYFRRVFSDLWDLGKLIEGIEQALHESWEMLEVIDLVPDILDKEGALSEGVSRGKIEFSKVGFSYNGEQESIFSDFSLLIKPGEKVGLVGPSGGGKSTVIKLIQRFYDIDSGSIKVDGVDVRDYRQEYLRQSIAYVPQDTSLFHRSLSDNIRYGNREVNDRQVVEVSKLAHADNFIRNFQDGYDSMVGERGLKLSGGQRQRVAIARAMLIDSPILLLDEATSALDSKSEKYISESLIRLMKNRTTVVIAHRLSTIKQMDRIIYIDSGEIIEEGSHDQLIARKGKYADLWSHQVGDFLGE